MLPYRSSFLRQRLGECNSYHKSKSREETGAATLNQPTERAHGITKYYYMDTLSTDKTYTIIAESITSTAQQVLGKYRKKIQPWITDDNLDLCDKRRELKAMKNNSDKLKDEYREVHNLIRRSMTKQKKIG